MKDKSIVFFIKRYKANTVYNSSKEIRALLNELTPREVDLYLHVRDMVHSHPPAIELKNDRLEIALGMSKRAVIDTKASLKKKGWLVITFGKDGCGDLTAQVYVGKEQVANFLLGVKLEISDTQAYKKLETMFGFGELNLTDVERKDRLERAHLYFKEHPEEFK
jgi:hypothetical protein